MACYPFKCFVDDCENNIEVFHPIKDYDNMSHPVCPIHGRMEQVVSLGGFVLARTPGKNTGFYDLDYGKRATEDLTVPGKMEMLKKEGRIKDPFDDLPPQEPTAEDYAAFSD